MSGFQAPITISEALSRIEKNEYVLPAFQREFLWNYERIENLFDSLMQGYPISSMLFWKVKGETKAKWKFYEFISDFISGARGNHNSNKIFKTSNSNDFFAILDGQQRLTSIRIGLYGTYAYHERYKSYDYGPENFPKRILYLNLSKKGGIDDDKAYFFEFKKVDDTRSKNFYKDINGNLWFRVGAVIDLNNSREEISDYFKDEVLSNDEKLNLTKEQRQIIYALKKVIYQDQVINFYLEEDQNPDKAVNIFTRINSGGINLDFADIVFSLIVANWKEDARTDISELINVIDQKGFKIDKKYIVKAFLYLHHSNVKTEINSFEKVFCDLLEKNWKKIRDAIITLFNLIKDFGLTSFNLTSNNATLPILYYIYHNNLTNDFVTDIKYQGVRSEIKKWLLSAILKRTFGGQSDSTLQKARKYFTDNINKPLSNNKSFNGQGLNKAINQEEIINDEFIDELLATQKDNCYAFPILSLLYPHFDYKNRNDWNIDHIYPKKLYSELPAEVRNVYDEKAYNSLVNLQIYDSHLNKSKNDETPEDWIKEKCPSTSDRKGFLEKCLIPDITLSFENFPEFYTKRKKILRQKLKSLII